MLYCLLEFTKYMRVSDLAYSVLLILIDLVLRCIFYWYVCGCILNTITFYLTLQGVFLRIRLPTEFCYMSPFWNLQSLDCFGQHIRSATDYFPFISIVYLPNLV